MTFFKQSRRLRISQRCFSISERYLSIFKSSSGMSVCIRTGNQYCWYGDKKTYAFISVYSIKEYEDIIDMIDHIL